jgi:hypothetical protein
MFELVLIIVGLVLNAALIGTVIYLYVRVINIEESTNKSVLEIKSKIGSIIRDINNINRIEYEVDMEQEHRLNNLSKKLI